MGDEVEFPAEYSLVNDAGESLPCSDGYSGHGKAAYATGDTYDGEFLDGKRNGKGIYTWANGAKFDGDYNQNSRSYGKLTYPDGSFYVGHYKDNKNNGFGTRKYANGDVYTGHWINGKKHNEGTYEFGLSAQRLKGSWDNGKLSRGSWSWSDGTHWDGSFRYQQPHGSGTWTFPSGASERGEYVQTVRPTKDHDDVDGKEVCLTWSVKA